MTWVLVDFDDLKPGDAWVDSDGEIQLVKSVLTGSDGLRSLRCYWLWSDGEFTARSRRLTKKNMDDWQPTQEQLAALDYTEMNWDRGEMLALADDNDCVRVWRSLPAPPKFSSPEEADAWMEANR